MFADFGVSEDCINHYSYGEICVRCGCCSMNTDYRDRVIKIIRYYKECLKEELSFDNWCIDADFREIQEKNIKSNILYCKRKIRMYKKILKTLKKAV